MSRNLRAQGAIALTVAGALTLSATTSMVLGELDAATKATGTACTGTAAPARTAQRTYAIAATASCMLMMLGIGLGCAGARAQVTHPRKHRTAQATLIGVPAPHSR